ncbi:hypothetical protein LZL87_013590 [Fusarium oxysporum]|nr:hypothetical protein LZL87_013590 [Fusarium oxysporum]
MGGDLIRNSIRRSKDTTLVKDKPTPIGFKVWVNAQDGYFLRWLWGVKGSPYTAVVVKLPSSKPQGQKGKPKTFVALSNIQNVVLQLCTMLPKQTYNVFTDNLFSSPNLFCALREAGYGITGTARLNCDIREELKEAEGRDKASIALFFSTIR